jgi:hypothetical protein
MIFSSWIVSFDFVLPRLRCPSPAGLSGFGSVAFSMPLGLRFGRRGPPLRRAISSTCAATVRRNSHAPLPPLRVAGASEVEAFSSTSRRRVLASVVSAELPT